MKDELSPVDAEYQLAILDKACGMLAGTGLSSYEFMASKKFEKELEDRQSERRCAMWRKLDLDELKERVKEWQQ